MDTGAVLAVEYRRPGVAVRIQSGPGRLLELVEDSPDLGVSRPIVRRPRDHARPELVLELQRVGDGGHQVRVPAQHLDARTHGPRGVAFADEIVRRGPGRALPATEEPNVHRCPLRRAGPGRAATARPTPARPQPRRPRPPRDGCSPSARAGSGCCRSARSAGCARVALDGEGRSGPAPRPRHRLPQQRGGRHAGRRRLLPPGGVLRPRDAGGDHDGAALSHARTVAGVRGATPPVRPLPRQRRGRPGVRRGAQPPLASPNVQHWVCWLSYRSGHANAYAEVPNGDLSRRCARDSLPRDGPAVPSHSRPAPCGAWETPCRVHHAGRWAIPNRASVTPGTPDAGHGWPDCTRSVATPWASSSIRSAIRWAGSRSCSTLQSAA